MFKNSGSVHICAQNIMRNYNNHAYNIKCFITTRQFNDFLASVSVDSMIPCEAYMNTAKTVY